MDAIEPKLQSNSMIKKRRIKRWESPIAGYLFIAPWLVGFLALTMWPMIQSLYYSFTDFGLFEPARWIGVRNYRNIATNDEIFRISLRVTLLFVVLSVPIKLLTALAVAMLLNRDIKGISLFRTLIYFPSLIGTSIAVAILWRNMFDADGFINRVLDLFGLQGLSWIGDPRTALGTLVILIAWQFGSSMVIFLAGLKQIPRELYEAASVDGAGRITQLMRVTLPMLSPVILFNLILQTIGSFQMFTQAFIITQGGPINSTYMFALYLYDRAFSRFEMGYASSLAWIMVIIIGLFTAVIFGSSRYWVYYESGGDKK